MKETECHISTMKKHGDNMSAIIVPAKIAVLDPMPFPIPDVFDALGQLCVVRDEDWDEIVGLMTHEDNYVIETSQGPFLMVHVNPLRTAEVQDEKTKL
jgi:hypothetical protein